VKKERRLSKIETLTLAKNYITALTDIVVANGGNASLQQPNNNCNNQIANLISINNAIVISPNQDVNNNEQTRTIRHNESNGDDSTVAAVPVPIAVANDLNELEPSFFGNATDPFEII
jgi:hypothetical protein